MLYLPCATEDNCLCLVLLFVVVGWLFCGFCFVFVYLFVCLYFLHSGSEGWIMYVRI